MSTLVQISDTHFGTEQEEVVRALAALVRQVKPSLLVLSGDITQRARRSQFAAARRFVDMLDAPKFLCVPGNHDIPLFNVFARVFAPYGNYTRAFGADLEPEHECEDWIAIGVNTTRPRRRKDGEVSEQQIARVCQRLRAAHPTQLRIVVIHQPVHVIRSEDVRNLLHGYEAAVRSWAAAGADIIMGGHIHLPYIRPLTESFVDLPRRVWCVQAGTALSHRVRGNVPNSVNVVRHESDEQIAQVERWDFNAQQHCFECILAETLHLDRRAVPVADSR